uniref:Uncharacterized protein n=1 Tax=Mustela putorius furo TaxID=9669 RepID=M3XR10_MUSPF
ESCLGEFFLLPYSLGSPFNRGHYTSRSFWSCCTRRTRTGQRLSRDAQLLTFRVGSTLHREPSARTKPSPGNFLKVCDEIPPCGGDGIGDPRGASEGAGGLGGGGTLGRAPGRRVWAGFAATQSPPVDVAAGTSESLNVLKKKGDEDSREGKLGGKRIKNSPHKLAEPLIAQTDDFI